MITKHQIKLIKSLAQKKYRYQHGLFIVEGIKGIEEFLNSDFQLQSLFTTEQVFDVPEDLGFMISKAELKKISSLKNPNTALAVFRIPEAIPTHPKGLIVALDSVRDPGNLGTIIRLCDWYGVKYLLCGNDTVDCFNAKVVQATMGSLSRVTVTYLNLKEFLSSYEEKIFGTFMDGKNIYTLDLPKNGLIILGNEANGISEDIKRLVNEEITIPRFGNNKKTESLNVANATAIVLSEFRRRTIEM